MARLSDAPRIVILSFPVRCVICGERSYLWLLTVLRLKASQRKYPARIE